MIRVTRPLFRHEIGKIHKKSSYRRLDLLQNAIMSSGSETTPIPCHVSVDSGNESHMAPSLSPVTLDSSSPTAKKHLFLDEIMEGATDEIHYGMATLEEEDQEAMFVEKKSDEILDCLNGVPIPASARKSRSRREDISEEDRLVDLWHLRQLALSKGGLLNASIRKRAWLKLVDANEGILMSLSTVTDNKSTGEPINLSDNEINLIQQDIKTCIWNIEAEIKHSRRSRRQQRGRSGSTSADDNASLASFESGFSSVKSGRTTPLHIPEAFSPSGTSAPSSGSSTPVSGVYNLRSVTRKKGERKLLLNIITSVLRTSPEEVKELDMKRIYYFQGMHNIAAPILITLESPSLTSLVLKRLSLYHLKDSMIPMNAQVNIRTMFMPLLKHVDRSLYSLLVRKGVTDPCSFALSWILCWFTNDISDYDIVSRLLDVLLVSHFTFPIYMAVAMLTNPHNRSMIEMAAQVHKGTDLANVLSRLPATMVTSKNRRDAMSAVESVIEVSVSYM